MSDTPKTIAAANRCIKILVACSSDESFKTAIKTICADLLETCKELERGKTSVEAKQKCAWTKNEDGYFETSCVNAFEMNNPDLQKNNFNFCPFCGGRIEETKE